MGYVKQVKEVEIEIGDDVFYVDTVFGVNYNFSKGCGAYTPPGEYAPIDPPEPDEIEVTDIEIVEHDGQDVPMSEQDLHERLIASVDWFGGEYDEELMQDYHDADEAAREDYYDAKRQDAILGE